jgi:hypothetical protein
MNGVADQPILVTGAAGFIGFHVAERLLEAGRHVVGLDNLNSYYAPALKQARLDILRDHSGFSFKKLDLVDGAAVNRGRHSPICCVVSGLSRLVIAGSASSGQCVNGASAWPPNSRVLVSMGVEAFNPLARKQRARTSVSGTLAFVAEDQNRKRRPTVGSRLLRTR